VGRCITVCGDQDQSIYGFREDECSDHNNPGRRRRGNTNFDQFLAYWQRANIVKLERNYRSTGHLVRAASALIAKNGGSATSCSCETHNGDGQKILVLPSNSEEREVQVRKLPKILDLP
jgi:DNA helicase-2/ATP-dependent DNA helicase PcrA